MICFVVVLQIYFCIHYYNRFIVLETQVLTDKAQIEAHYQRRKDLIVNLTKTVVNYADHERKMFGYVSDTRSASLESPDKLLDTLKAAGVLDLEKLKKGDLSETNKLISAFGKDGGLDLDKLRGGSMGDATAKLMALAENYPSLKLNENLQKLMEALINIEDRIVERRMAYNTSVNVYGTYTSKFPQFIFSFIFGFKQHQFIKVDSDAELVDRVEY